MAALLLASAVPALADDASAFKDWNEGRRDEAVAEWRRLAVEGDPLAQYNLALRYLKGEGVPQSRDMAIEWLGKSADGGFVRSMEMLGTLLIGESGFKPNYPDALRLLSEAAQAGSLVAKNNLAVLYMEGRGTPVDLPRAHRYAEEAVQGGAPASNLVAEIESRMSPQQLAEVKAVPAIPPAPTVIAAASDAEAPKEAPPVSPPLADKPGQNWLVQIASVASPADARREWQRQQKLSPKLAAAKPVYVDVSLSPRRAGYPHIHRRVRRPRQRQALL